jgi:LysM repeat protein
VTYRATGGETIAQVAAKYNASVEEVVKQNGIAANTPLSRGQQIQVPSRGGSAPAASAPATSRRRR